MKGRGGRIARVREALAAVNAEFEARTLAENTATAALAAGALGCAEAQIAKTIVFRERGGGGGATPVVAVLCGDDRVDVRALAAAAGCRLEKADAEFIRAQCGFEIGGVAPLGFSHTVPVIPVFLEDGLWRFARIWAAAGSAYAVFGIAPDELRRVGGGRRAVFAAVKAV